MIVLTVKTLDSQNHTFTVDDDITVEEFKTKIAETVNIPADTQRIIYCGRVLQDDAKLSDYDVNGKVVHLVQRPPPSANPPTTRSASPQPSGRRPGFRNLDGGNTMYLGSMAFPSNLMESQGIVPPPPTHSLAGSRLNVARRMLRRAEAVITLLENPSARPSEPASTEEQQEEEVTPIIEARVIVPPGNEPIDEAMVLSAVQNSLFDAGAIPIGAQVTVDSNASGTSGSSSTTPCTERSASSTPEEAPAPSTTEPSSGESRSGGVSARSLAENASRTTEMAELLSTLNQLQVRFTPFLERYRHFMIEDPIIPAENARQTQAMLTRVSEVLHFLSHAYHSLSDIIIRVRTPPPRPLLCRPILIQHSAMVQAGIPIQVEVAQFNLSAERPNQANASTTTETTSTATMTTTTTTSSGDAASASSEPTPQPQPTMNIRGFPFIPAAAMRVQSFPFELRPGARQMANGSLGQNNNNNTVGATESTTGATTTTATTTTSATSGSSGHRTEGTFTLPNFNNSSVEFFMEVSPEVLHGTLNGPPPEFLQSLVQMAGQIMNRATNTSVPSTPSSTTTGTDSTQTNATPQTAAGQNSQARGNTQTHPTTATHTRSTPRPHVHLAQQAMQGGFDPFLPCNSHHLTHRRRNNQAASEQRREERREGEGAARDAGDARRREETTPPTLHNFMDDISTTFWTAYRRRFAEATRRRQGTAEAAAGGAASTAAGAASAGATAASAATTEAGNRPQFRSFESVLPDLQSTLANLQANLPGMLQGPTIADILQQLPPDDLPVRPGESVITDIFMFLCRNLTIVDMTNLYAGNFAPLERMTDEIQSFITTRLLDGSTTPEAINGAVDSLMNEMQPFLQNFSRLRVRDDIDIVRSLELLLRRRLAECITTATRLASEGVPRFVHQCLALVRLMCALTLHASANGLPGVVETFEQIITSFMQGIPAELQHWTLASSCANVRQFLSNLGYTESDVQPYIVRTSDVAMPSEPSRTQDEAKTETTPEVEPMELDEPEVVPETREEETAAAAISLPTPEEDPEPLPNVVIGSEAWHGQLPEDWVPIITRDVQRQRRQNSQAQFSDAYLSGMPTKRRKIVTSSKPQGSLPQVISDGVRRAVTATGLTQIAPIEVVAQAAGNSADVQSAYRNLLRSTVQSALRDNEDFNPERFPNASTYFNSQ